MSEQAFKYRIISQDRVYLCMDFGFEGRGCLAKEAIRERNRGDAIPLLPWVRFTGDVIIEPIVAKSNNEFYCDGHQELPVQTTKIEFHDSVEPSSRLIWNDNTAEELARMVHAADLGQKMIGGEWPLDGLAREQELARVA